MTPDNYIENALRTEKYDHDTFTRIDIRLLHAAMGMQTEAAEFSDQLKKHIFYGKELDITNLKEEIGDLFWYAAIACSSLGISFEAIFVKNIEKLKARYPEGFSKEKANNRDIEKERMKLESPCG